MPTNNNEGEILLSRKVSKSLDKYYTKSKTAHYCLQQIKILLKAKGYIFNEMMFIEPSAGSGVFLDYIESNRAVGFDIEPTRSDVIRGDFLGSGNKLKWSDKNIIVGNPPFGKKGSTAIQFINKSLFLSNIVCFILPIQFRKWSTQKHIKQGARLIYDEDLPDNSFTFLGRDYELRCCFQIWIDGNKESFKDDKDLRLLSPPPTKHKDFDLFQYNCTDKAERFFDYNWDFAVLRQGWGDFNTIYTKQDKDSMSRKKQWIFFKAKNDTILSNLKSIDFNKVAELNSSVKGFGKADIVNHYSGCYQ